MKDCLLCRSRTIQQPHLGHNQVFFLPFTLTEEELTSNRRVHKTIMFILDLLILILKNESVDINDLDLVQIDHHLVILL